MDIRKVSGNRAPSSGFCWKCGKWIPDDYKSCPECGSPVYEEGAFEETGKVCDNCGHFLKPASIFCPFCGKGSGRKPERDLGDDFRERTMACVYAPPEIMLRKTGRCENCGQELEPGAKFCPACGEAQRSSSAEDAYPSRKITGGENGPDELGFTREVYAPPEVIAPKKRDKAADFRPPMGEVYAPPEVIARKKQDESSDSGHNPMRTSMNCVYAPPEAFARNKREKQKKPWARLFAKWRGEDK